MSALPNPDPDAVDSIFGRIVSGDDVERWCVQLVQRWVSTYLSEVERQHGVSAGTLQRPRAYVTAPSLDKWPEDQLPAVILVSVGLSDAPIKAGDGKYRARWDMGLACVCSARTQAQSHSAAMSYMAALRALFVQRPSLDGRADGTMWNSETYDDIDYDDARSLSAGIAHFIVDVCDVTTANAGPVTPDAPLPDDTEPWPLWPQVLTTDIDVEAVDVID
jgi:hypothetical protein